MIIHCFLHRAYGVQVVVAITEWVPTQLPTFLHFPHPHTHTTYCPYGRNLPPISFRVSQILPTYRLVGYWVPCMHKGYFLTCSCDSQEAENSRKTSAQVSKA